MSIRACVGAFFCVVLMGSGRIAAQQAGAPSAALPGRIVLDVVVTPKSGPPVSGLQQQDFTVLDNKVPRTLTSFEAVDGRQAKIAVVVLIDAVNIGYQSVALQRQEIEKFLRADGGRLAYPTTVAALTDTGVHVQPNFATDGNAISAGLEQDTIGLRNIGRSAGFYGATERLDDSLQGLRQLVAHLVGRPGRKLILWVSPGWPLLSGPEVQLTDKQQKGIFEDIVAISTGLRQARVTLYSIDPLGTADIGTRTFYWESFRKGLSKANQAQMGNLGLQVIATQSGGLVLNASNDVAGELQKCIADNGVYYELSFDAPIDDRPEQYHQLEVKVGKPGLTARTRQGYYSPRQH